MTNQQPKILIMAGGTGGHIFPGLAVAEYLSALGWQPQWLGSAEGMEETLVAKNHIPLHLLKITGLRGKSIIALLKAPFKLLLALFQALKVINKVKPNVVLGMGGFASGPGGLAAYLLRCPLVIHEQNAVAGLTNRYLHKISDKTLMAFPGAFPESEKTIVTGNPIRNDIHQLPSPTERLIKESETLKLLIVGGSRGAQIFNQKLPEAIASFDLKKKLSIWHQVGAANEEEVKQEYRQHLSNKELENVRVNEFIHDMAKAYQWADAVICRAGALTISELSAVGLASILVPYPYAVDDHQTKNAEFLAQQKAAILLPQQDFTAQRLQQLLRTWLEDYSKCYEMANKARKLAYTHSTQEVAEHCIKVAKGKIDD